MLDGCVNLSAFPFSLDGFLRSQLRSCHQREPHPHQPPNVVWSIYRTSRPTYTTASSARITHPLGSNTRRSMPIFSCDDDLLFGYGRLTVLRLISSSMVDYINTSSFRGFKHPETAPRTALFDGLASLQDVNTCSS